MQVCMANDEQKHNWQLYKPDQKYYIRCENCLEVVEVSFRLRQLLDDRETVYRSLAYTSARAGREGAEVSADTHQYVDARLRRLNEAIDEEIKNVIEDQLADTGLDPV